MAWQVKNLALVTAEAQIAAVAWVQSLAQELPYAVGVTKKIYIVFSGHLTPCGICYPSRNSVSENLASQTPSPRHPHAVPASLWTEMMVPSNRPHWRGCCRSILDSFWAGQWKHSFFFFPPLIKIGGIHSTLSPQTMVQTFHELQISHICQSLLSHLTSLARMSALWSRAYCLALV